MIQNCKMRHENGNCLPAGGFCTANKNICEALQNAYEMGQRNAIRKNGKWIYKYCVWFCSECGNSPTKGMGYVQGHDELYDFCPHCGADMRERKEE